MKSCRSILFYWSIRKGREMKFTVANWKVMHMAKSNMSCTYVVVGSELLLKLREKIWVSP